MDRPIIVITVSLLLGVLSACASLPTVAPLRLVERELIEDGPAERVYSLQFETAAGTPVSAYLRRPATVGEERGTWGVVMVAGRETGRRAAAIIPGPIDGLVLAVEYPGAIPEDIEPMEMLDDLPSIRRTALRMPAILRGAAHYLAEHPEVDSTRIALVGVSFGVPFAAAAGRDPVFRGVALHYGGAGLESIFRANLAIENRFLRGLAAQLGAWYFRELDPARHVGAISPTPLLLINGLYDELIPRESVLRLIAAAEPPVRHIWLPHGHLMPDDFALMRELADSTISHFEFLRN